jgi:hypothetical protein
MKNSWFLAGSLVLMCVAGFPRDDRPIAIEGASQRIVHAVVEGPRFFPPQIFPGIEDYHNPRVTRIRQEYRLDDIVAGVSDEFRKLRMIRHWVHTRWPIDNNQTEGGDAFAILEKAKKGLGFYCTHSMIVQHAVLTAMGYVARDLGVDRNHEDLGRSIHHGVTEVWSNQYAKWILMDAKHDVHYERAGIPLSALELHEAVRADGGKGIVMLRGIEREQVQDIPDAPEATPREYWWVSYYLRPNPFTEQHWTGGDRLLIPDDEGFHKTTWMRDEEIGKPVKHWAYKAGAFIPVKDRQEIDWTPGVTDLRVRQRAEGDLEVSLRSATPNLETYLVRSNGGEWKPVAGDETRWKLQPGKNRLDVRTRNLAGVEGPIASLVVDYR